MTNPSSSFKARRAACAVAFAKAHGYKGVIAATSSNYDAAVAPGRDAGLSGHRPGSLRLPGGGPARIIEKAGPARPCMRPRWCRSPWAEALL